MIANIINNRIVPPARTREASGWTVAHSGRQDLALALKCVHRDRPSPPMQQRVEALEAIGREARWLSDQDFELIVKNTGTSMRFARLSIARINEWLAHLGDYARALGTLDGPGLMRGGVRQVPGPAVAYVLAGDASSLAPFALIHAALAGVPVVAKASSVEPLSPYRFIEAMMEKGLEAPNLLCFDTSAEEDRSLIREMVSKCRQAAIWGEDRTVETIYSGLPANASHKPIPYWSGRSAAVVLPGADLKVAARCIVEGTAEDRGNRCVCTKKLFAPREVQGELERLLIEEAERLVRGDPQNPATQIGRLEPAARATADAAVADSEVIYDRDVVMARCADLAKPMQEELPYPLLGIRYFAGDEDPVALANACVRRTPAGRSLVTAVFSAARDEAEALSARLATCKVLWNRPTTFIDLTTPHQGMYLFLELMRAAAFA